MSPRVRLGLFVLLAGLLFSAMVVLFGSLPMLFERTTNYTIRFTDAPGLAVGAPVRRSGVRIGEVTGITLDEERGIVRVRIAIRSPFTIRKSDQATIVTGLLGSDAAIDFQPRPVEPGEPVDRDVVEPGAELVGQRPATVGSLLRGASDVVPTTQETLAEIRKSIQRLEKLAARVEKSVPLAEDTMRAYRDLAQQAQQSIPELEKTNAQAQEFLRSARGVLPEAERAVEQYRLLAQDVRGAVPEVLKTNRELQELARGLQNALPSVERAVDEFRELASDVRRMAPTFRNAVEDVAAASRTATRLMEEFDVFWRNNRDTVQEILQNVNRVAGQTSKLVSDENIGRVNATLMNLRTASEQFPRISQNTADITDQGRTTVRRVNEMLPAMERSLAEFQKTMIAAQAALEELRRVVGPLGGRSEQISRSLDESLVRLNQTLGDVRALMTAIDRADGTLKKFLTDPSLYNNLNGAVLLVMQLVPRLDRILKDFETFADKLTRHPEAIGLGGVVRPGSGLKNPPTPPISAQPQAPVIHTPFSPKQR